MVNIFPQHPHGLLPYDDLFLVLIDYIIDNIFIYAPKKNILPAVGVLFILTFDSSIAKESILIPILNIGDKNI